MRHETYNRYVTTFFKPSDGTPLMTALKDERLDVFEHILDPKNSLKSMIDIECESYIERWNKKTKVSPLNWAILHKKNDIAHRLILEGADTKYSMSHAILVDSGYIFKILYKKVSSDKILDLLNTAFQCNSKKIVSVFLENVDITITERTQQIMQAAILRDVQRTAGYKIFKEDDVTRYFGKIIKFCKKNNIAVDVAEIAAEGYTKNNCAVLQALLENYRDLKLPSYPMIVLNYSLREYLNSDLCKNAYVLAYLNELMEKTPDSPKKAEVVLEEVYKVVRGEVKIDDKDLSEYGSELVIDWIKRNFKEQVTKPSSQLSGVDNVQVNVQLEL